MSKFLRWDRMRKAVCYACGIVYQWEGFMPTSEAYCIECSKPLSLYRRRKGESPKVKEVDQEWLSKK